VYPLFLGMVHLEKGALEPAQEALDRAIELDGENALARNYAALVKWEAGDRREAVKALLDIDFIQSSRFEARLLVRVEEALSASGHHESPFWSIGEGEGDGGDRFILNRWVAAFERGRARRQARRAASLVRQGRHEAALTRLEAAHRMAPGEPEIREALGRARKQVAKELDDPYLTGTLCFKNGDMESARSRLGPWLEEAKEPESRFMALGMLCEAELARGDVKKASAHLDEVLVLDPHDLYAQYLKGRLAVARGDRVEARRAFERFLDREPSFARVRLRVLEKMET
jgi:tetratricopeptide (TPR) repeat protein